jgi:pimeloyl-ACP methyl ester carboxylesterase
MSRSTVGYNRRRRGKLPYAGVGGLRLYYERRGSGEPLVFISGLGGHVAEIPHLQESYGRHFDFVAFDGRGCGRSDVPEGPYTIARYADDAAEFLAAVGLDSAFVYGSSMGGMVAQELCLRHPSRVRGLVLGCTTAGAVRGAQPDPATLETLVRNQSLSGQEAVEAGWRLGYSEAFIEAQRERLLAMAREATPWKAPRDSYMRQVLAAAQHDVYDRLHEVRCPVLIIHGADDLLVPPGNAHLLRERIPHAELHVLDGAGHGYNLEAQDRADALVIDFVRRHAAVRPASSAVR